MSPRTLDEGLTRLSRVVGDRFGIVRGVELPRLEAGDPPVWVAESHPARLVGGGDHGALNEGGGAGLRRETAIIKAVAESVERYCAAIPSGEERLGLSREIGPTACPPDEFTLFSERQYSTPGFPFARFDQRTSVRWVRGSSLSGREEQWVPAAFVFLPYRSKAGEPRITTSVSTGLAAGCSRSEAAAAALREVIERDAFMLTWRHRLPTPAIDIDDLGPGAESELVAALRSIGMHCRARLLTLDIELPVVAVILRGRVAAHPAVVMGAGAAVEPRRALRLALEEACLSLFGINRLRRSLGARAASLQDRELTSLALQSTAFAVRPELADGAPFLLGDASDGNLTMSDLERRFATVDEDVRQLAETLGEWGEWATMVDCTTADIREAGLHVVRVIVPRLRPLDHDAAVPHLGGKRWLSGPIDPGPHPFP